MARKESIWYSLSRAGIQGKWPSFQDRALPCVCCQGRAFLTMVTDNSKGCHGENGHGAVGKGSSGSGWPTGARHLPLPWRGASRELQSALSCSQNKQLERRRRWSRIQFLQEALHLSLCLSRSGRGQPRTSKPLPKDPFTSQGGWTNINKNSLIRS